MCNTQCGLSTLPANTTLIQCWFNAGQPSATLAQHQTSTGSTPRVCWAACWRPVQADTDPMSVKHWASFGAGQYPFSPGQYFMLAVPVSSQIYWPAKSNHTNMAAGWVYWACVENMTTRGVVLKGSVSCLNLYRFTACIDVLTENNILVKFKQVML